MTEKSKGVESRVIAADVICRWLKAGDFPDRLIPDDARDHAFVTDIVYGTARRRNTLEYVLSRFVKKSPGNDVKAYLLIGTYQTLFMPDVPDHAAIHETVEAAKSLAVAKSRFVNAVLRNVQRNRDTLLADISHADPAVRESHPEELVARWQAEFGVKTAERLCIIDNVPAETTITTLPFADSARTEQLLRNFSEAGIPARRHTLDDGAIVIGHGVRVKDLPGYNEGLFIVQDAAPLAALRLLAPKPGETVLDACAAPGGKTMQIAAAVGENGHVIAMDLHEDRLARLRENVTRVHFESRVEVRTGDASSAETAETLKNRHIDAVLIDAPCSNTGVLRRRADARWRFSAKRLATLHNTQLAILTNLADLFGSRPSTLNPQLSTTTSNIEHRMSTCRMVYSTCSIEHEEDEDVVAEFLVSHPDWRLADSVKLLPDDSPRDGAYAALLVK